MAVKTTQFSYDDEWLKRKIKTKATWKQVMEAGIMALEEKMDLNAQAPAPKSMPQPEEVVSDAAPASSPPAETEPTPPAEQNSNQYYFRVTKPDTVATREFDVLHTSLDEDNNTVREWRPVPFDEIELDAIFRVRDDGVVLNVSGYKRFRKLSTIENFEGKERVMVEVFQDALAKA